MAKHLAPSRQRYFDNHPVIGIRLPVHLRDELQIYAQSHGMTLNALVQKLFKDQSEHLGNFMAGYLFGLSEGGKDSFAISCSSCGRTLTLSREELAKVLMVVVGNLEGVKCQYCDQTTRLEVNKKQEVAAP